MRTQIIKPYTHFFIDHKGWGHFPGHVPLGGKQLIADATAVRGHASEHHRRVRANAQGEFLGGGQFIPPPKHKSPGFAVQPKTKHGIKTQTPFTQRQIEQKCGLSQWKGRNQGDAVVGAGDYPWKDGGCCGAVGLLGQYGAKKWEDAD